MEANCHAPWFERLLAELNFELWVGDAAEIRAKRVRFGNYDQISEFLSCRLIRR